MMDSSSKCLLGKGPKCLNKCKCVRQNMRVKSSLTQNSVKPRNSLLWAKSNKRKNNMLTYWKTNNNKAYEFIMMLLLSSSFHTEDTTESFICSVVQWLWMESMRMLVVHRLHSRCPILNLFSIIKSFFSFDSKLMTT